MQKIKWDLVVQIVTTIWKVLHRYSLEKCNTTYLE